MNEVTALFTIIRQQSARVIRTQLLTSPKKVIVATILWIIFWGILYILFFEGWRFLSHQVFILRESIAANVWALFFFPLMIMLAFSACVISFSSLYQSRETEFLLTNPISDGAVFAHKMREAIAFSGWATLFLALPLVLTYGKFFATNFWFYPAAFLAFAPFVVLSASVGTLIAVFVGLFAPRKRKILLWGVIVLAVYGAYQVFEIFVEGRKAVANAEQGFWLREVFDRIDVLRSEFIPSGWMGEIISTAANGQWGDYLFFLVLLTANAMLVVHFTLLVGGRSLRRAHQRVAVTTGTAKTRANGPLSRFLRTSLFFLDPVHREMILKDLKTFLRSPGQWTQFLIFFSLLGFYILNLRTFNYHIRSEYWRMLISYTNFTAVGLVLASFTGRFVFPLVSLEGNRIWVLGLAPVSRRSIVMAKFWFSFLGTGVISLMLVIASDLLLNLDPALLAVQSITMLLICFGLSGLSVGLGALYPNFKEDNPARIISGFGGTINLVFSLAYVLTTVFAVALPFQLAEKLSMRPALSTALVGVSIVSSALLAYLCGYLPLRTGIRSFEKAEF